MFWRWSYKTDLPNQKVIGYFDKLIDDSEGEITIGDLVLYSEGCHFLKRDGNKIHGIFSGDESRPRCGYRYSFSLKIDTKDNKTVIKCSVRPGWFGMIASVVVPFGVLASVTFFSDALIPIFIIGLCVIALNTIAVVDFKKDLDNVINKLQ